MDQTNRINRFKSRWRHFRPRRILKKLKSLPRSPQIKHDIFSEVGAYVMGQLPRRRPKPHRMDDLIVQFRSRAEATNKPEDWLAALFIQTPRAAKSQQLLDQYSHGYHDKKARVFELIDFNDTFVGTVLSLSEHDRCCFAEQAKKQMDRVCFHVHTEMFSDEQWTAIVRGLTREIAVYQAARDRGFDAFMPNRTADALGVDLQVRDPETGRYINVDVKTPSSFRRRLEDLVQQGRLTEQDLLLADQRSYVVETNGKNGGSIQVILLCMLPDRFGEFGHFRLQNSEPMRQMLNYLIREYGLSDGRYAIHR